MKLLKRSIPSERQIKTRTAILNSYKDLKPINMGYYGLETGNSKTGSLGNNGEEVRVWNLPPVVTCPGAGECIKYCYNADTRASIFPIEKWCVNWYWSIFKKDELYKKLNDELKKMSKPIVRIHSSGDFFSTDYIDLWIKVISENENAKFWAYTKSWKDSSLLRKLEDLRALENLQLIASIESEYEKAPHGWRYCLVGNDERKAGLHNCDEQYLNGPSCVDCKVCFSTIKENIYFAKH